MRYINIRLVLNYLKEIHKLGARKIAVLSGPPVGCLPVQRTLSGGVLRKCVDNDNNAVQLFNDMLKQQLKFLESNLLQSRVAFVDFYNPLMSIIENPHQYGITISKILFYDYLCQNFNDARKFLVMWVFL